MNSKQALDGVRVLTTDAEKRIGLYAIRYLGRAGARVTGIARSEGAKRPIGFLSRYIHENVTLPEDRFQERFRNYLAEHAAEYDVLHPIDISQMLCVIDTVKCHDLAPACLLPPRESLVIADNKELLTRHAEENRLPCPRTFYRAEPSDLHALPGRGLTFPCIIKFRGDSRATHWRPEERYAIVDTPSSLRREYERMHAIEPYPVIQEYIVGQGFGFFALYDKKKKLKAGFCHKRVREYPPQGGPSSCCESIHDRELVRIGRRLLESLDWSGLAMVEFKFDVARKRFFIIEVNPRYWGSLPLAVYSGVNFPVLHILSALERDYADVTEYRLGVKVRFFERDLKALLELASREKQGFRKLRVLLEILDPSIKDGLFSFADMGPVLGRLLPFAKPAGSDNA